MDIKQNVKCKPFKWCDLELIVQFDFCPQCKLFKDCYNLQTIANEYDGEQCIKGQPNYIDQDCLDFHEE